MKIRVEIQEHDGAFHATSEQFPGFLLCSRDMAALEADLLPAMKTMVKIKDAHKKSAKSSKPKVAHNLVMTRELAFA